MAFFLLLLILIIYNVVAFYASYVRGNRRPEFFWIKLVASVVIIVALLPYL